MLVGFNTTINSAERGLEKAGNNIKYGAAAVATVGAGVGAVKLVNKHPSIFSNINKETVSTVLNNGKEGAKNIGKKLLSPDLYKGFFVSIKQNVMKVVTSVKNTGVKNTLAKIGSKILGSVKTVVSPIMKRIPKLSDLPRHLIGLIKKIPSAFTRALGLLKRLPVIGWIAAATAAILLLLSHKHGYKSGQIDQKYADRQKLFEKMA